MAKLTSKGKIVKRVLKREGVLKEFKEAVAHENDRSLTESYNSGVGGAFYWHLAPDSGVNWCNIDILVYEELDKEKTV